MNLAMKLRQRYGDCSDRSLERAVKDKRLPPPQYPFGNRVPGWREDVLDEHDRKAALEPRPKRKDVGKRAGLRSSSKSSYVS